MNIFFSGRLLNAVDLSAEQQASAPPAAAAAGPVPMPYPNVGASPGESLARSLPASRFEAFALNPQPLPPKDIGGLVTGVLHESYASSTEDLQAIADKVKSVNEAKKELREVLHGAREALDEAASHIKGLEGKLDSVGDDAQLANVDLQSALQKQQQTLQMMSNISKQVHDTLLNVIRKLGG